jgi:signal transduction histidine kinase
MLSLGERRRLERDRAALRGLTDRLAAIEGQLEVDSKPGRGTTVRASIPCPQPLSRSRDPG